MSSIKAEDIIQKLNLSPHPREGGFFREVYRSQESIPIDSRKKRTQSNTADRNLATAIYYLITEKQFSRLHRLQSDEIFHFYLGDPVEMINISLQGQLETITLGPNLLSGEKVQHLVPADVWQGAKLQEGQEGTEKDYGFALLGCTVSPGFEYVDYEEGDRENLLKIFPQFKLEISKYS